MTVQNEILNRLITSLKQVGYPSTNADGEITFYGSLLAMIESPETYDSQRKHWKATSTLSSYIQNYYIERILPQVDATKALRSYTIEDFETIINRIKLANPLLTQGVLNDCYYLVSCVYDAGFINELYPRKFIWSSPSNKMIPFYDREEELRKKAFDIDEELTIREWIAKNINPSQPGQAYGFMMMVALGLRNQCSAGADFNSIEDLTFGDVSSFFVFQSINPKTGKVQASGKSDNQTRRIALIHKIKTLLEERKAFLENEINSGRLLLPPDKSFNLLPIACKDHQYLEHYSILFEYKNQLFLPL